MKKLIYLGLLIIVFISCKNDDDNNFYPNSILGTYSGTFKVTYEGESFTNPVTVTFSEKGKYESTSSDDKMPAGGSGNFNYENSKITFQDENVWTADFDWNLILDGEYEYVLEANGYHLIFSADKNDAGYYEYDLWRPIPID